MIKQFAQTITSFLVHENAITKDEYEVYQYGTEQILINLLLLMMVIIASSITGWWIESVFYLIGLIPIRVTVGGYHASTPFRCSVLTFLVFGANLLIINVLRDKLTLLATMLLLGFILVCVVKIGPIDNKNKRLSRASYLTAWKRSNIVVIFVILVLFKLAGSDHALPAAFVHAA